MKLLALAAALLICVTTALAQSYCFGVTVTGKGKPVILIPGLTCGPNVWNAVVSQLQVKYECHVLSLPGFAGQAPIQGPYLKHVRDDIIAYVKDKKLDHPALIGHSLGGTLVFDLAEADPSLWGPLISVDGLPFLSLAYYPGASADSMKKVSDQIFSLVSSEKPATFKAGIHMNLVAGVTNPKIADLLFTKCEQSDQATVAEAMKETLTTDLRPKLGTIQSQVLLIGAGKQVKNDAEKKQLTEVYQGQLKGIPHARLYMDWGALHFVMLDDPRGFLEQVESFLGP